MVNKAELKEIGVAATIGAMIGVVIAITMIIQWGLSWWTIPVVCVSASMLSGIFYKPTEVRSIFIAVARQNFNLLSSSKLLVIVANPMHTGKKIAGWFQRNVVNIVICSFLFACAVSYIFSWWLAYVLLFWLCPILVGHYWVNFFLNAGFFAFGISWFIVRCAETEQKSKPASWVWPVISRLCVFTNNKYWYCNKKKRDNYPSFRSDIDSVKIIFRQAPKSLLECLLAPFALLVVAPVVLVIVALDTIVTAAMALASTKRLSVMTGAFIGTVSGSLLFLHNPTYIMLAVVASGVIGGFSGVGLYLLRDTLARKESMPHMA